VQAEAEQVVQLAWYVEQATHESPSELGVLAPLQVVQSPAKLVAS